MTAFTSTVLGDAPGIDAGEVIASKPNNVEAYSVFEEGVTVGRFVKYDAGSIDKLDASATPVIAGVVRRKTNRVLGDVDYNAAQDQVVEVVDFGHVTVTVTATANPTKFAPVYVSNTADAETGKATQSSVGTLLVAGAVFWEQIKTGVWVVRLKNYL